MDAQALGQFLLLLALLFGLSYMLAGLFERLHIPGILAALFVGIGMHYTPAAVLLSTGASGNVFTALANLGVLFLLFFIGLQIDLKAMRGQGSEIMMVTLLNTLLPFAAGMGVVRLMGYDWITAFVIGLACMPTAEAVIVPVLDAFRLVDTKIGRYIVGAGVLDDIFEVFLVAFVSVWIGSKTGLIDSKSHEILFLLGSVLGFALLSALSYRYLLKPLARWLPAKVANIIFLTVIVLFLFGGLAQYSDLGLVVGAIVAGMLMRPLMAGTTGLQAEKTVRALSFGFFGILFFLWVGLSVDLEGLLRSPALALLLFLAAFVGKLAGVMLMVPLKKLDMREAFAIGIGLNARLTTGIIVAKLLLDAGLIEAKLFTALVSAASLSTIIVPLLFSALASRYDHKTA